MAPGYHLGVRALLGLITAIHHMTSNRTFLSRTFHAIREALEVFENNKNSVDLVILDMRMPYNGGKAFDQLKRIKSDVKVIIASGYTEDQRIRQMYEQGCIGFIQKPFIINKLSEKILKALQN